MDKGWSLESWAPAHPSRKNLESEKQWIMLLGRICKDAVLGFWEPREGFRPEPELDGGQLAKTGTRWQWELLSDGDRGVGSL